MIRPPREARIDLTALARSGHLTPKTMRTRLAEEFRVIKRPLLLKASARGEHAVNSGNLIMVTSARPREGKTFTAINLAMSMASERDMAVLMVDISPRRDMCAQLGVASDRGLFEALVDPRMTLDEVTVRTNIPNLSVLPGGIEHAHATELLASQRMADLARELSSSDPGRMVVFDAPPVLASSVPSVLALYVGQTVVVVEKDSTSRNAVERALVLLQPCKDVCFVLNKAKFAFDSDRFGSYSAADGDAER